LSAIPIEGRLILDMVDCIEGEKNVFIYDKNKIKWYDDPSLVLTWNENDELLILSKDNDFELQTMTIATLDKTDYPIIYLGKCNQLTPSNYVLTMLPRGLGFYPFNMNHILPINLVKYKDCNINPLLKYDNCKPKVFQDKLLNSSNEIKEGFKQNTNKCWIFFIVLIILLIYINGRSRE
jgi:hypothetical protein